MSDWRDYADVYEGDEAEQIEHTVVGTLKVLEDLYSPQLDNRRDLFVYLPPSYAEGEQRYPVIYMHDGQNLFDVAISHAGEWEVDETIETLSEEGLEAIVVGIPSIPKRRMREYNPFQAQRMPGQGEEYLAFIVETIKPLIDRDFRTLDDRMATGIMGSSMGGLISLVGFFRYPEVFGLTGVVSPSLYVSGNAAFPYIERAPFVPGRIYIDVGTREGDEPEDELVEPSTLSQRYQAAVQRMVRLLVQKGYRDGEDLLFVEEEGYHHELAWARRLPGALRFLLGPHRRV